MRRCSGDVDCCSTSDHLDSGFRAALLVIFRDLLTVHRALRAAHSCSINLVVAEEDLSGNRLLVLAPLCEQRRAFYPEWDEEAEHGKEGRSETAHHCLSIVNNLPFLLGGNLYAKRVNINRRRLSEQASSRDSIRRVFGKVQKIDDSFFMYNHKVLDR